MDTEVLVGAEGFEPPTLWSQTRCATRLRYAPTLTRVTVGRDVGIVSRCERAVSWFDPTSIAIRLQLRWGTEQT